ncbi:MAG: protoporphyrinogen oxidase [Deltaproteobacteria bacterium]|nr:protoporphyrinogen oxidase [Deltaproteobacteria bacterium]
MKRVVVVGGGLSGLSAARALLDEAQARGVDLGLTLVEKDTTLGGKIRSTREDGFLCEAGPPGFLDNKPATLALARRLGIEERLLRSNDAARKRFVFSDGRLQQLPEDPVSFLLSDLLSIRGRLRIAADFLLPQGDPSEDESVASFVRRRLGQEALDKLIDPMSAGIYAGDPNVMSLKSCFPKVWQIEQQFGGLIKGMLALQQMAKARGQQGPQGAGPGGALWSFEEGAAELPDRLAVSMPEANIVAGAAAAALERAEGGWRVRTDDGGVWDADAVLVATPAYDAGALLGPLDPELADLAFGIPYVPAAVVCLGYRTTDVPHPLDGFGFLIPRAEGRKILGSRWDSSTFARRAPEGSALLTQIVGGARNPELLALADDELLRVVQDEMRVTLGIEARPAYAKVVRWRRAIPQYLVGHGERLRRIEGRVSALGGLFLGGNAYYGIGINDCTTHAAAVAPKVVTALGGGPAPEPPRGGPRL